MPDKRAANEPLNTGEQKPPEDAHMHDVDETTEVVEVSCPYPVPNSCKKRIVTRWLPKQPQSALSPEEESEFILSAVEQIPSSDALLASAPAPSPSSPPLSPTSAPKSSYKVEDIRPEPRSFDDLFRSDADIYVWSGPDQRGHFKKKLETEFKFEAFRNKQWALDIHGKLDLSHQVTVIYISEFFDNFDNIMIMVKGIRNMMTLMGGTYTKKAYTGACFVTPSSFYKFEAIFPADINGNQFEKVPRCETKGIRWRYLYHTAVAALAHLEFDQAKWDRIQRIGVDREASIDLSDTISDTTEESTEEYEPKEVEAELRQRNGGEEAVQGGGEVDGCEGNVLDTQTRTEEPADVLTKAMAGVGVEEMRRDSKTEK